jgi:hypothetical protein
VIDEEKSGSGSSGQEEERRAAARMPEEMEAIRDRRGVVAGFLVVSLIAALFLGYGVFMYFAIGDKGPPDWDFGSIEDTPAQSPYSTAPPGATEPQHVNGKPSGAETPKGLDRK